MIISSSSIQYLDLLAALSNTPPENFHYEKSFGTRCIDASPDDKLQPDAPFVLSSCANVIIAVAALQCVELGLLDLDGDVTAILPELRNQVVLTGFERETEVPVLEKSKCMMSLRFVANSSDFCGFVSSFSIIPTPDLSQKTSLCYSCIHCRHSSRG